MTDPAASNQSLHFDVDLIRRYDVTGPRYTSYPTALQFDPGFDADALRTQAAMSNESGRPLSLYFHIPFCDTVCFYCACNKVITKNRKRAAPYLEALHREIALQAGMYEPGRVVDQLHWGGGTPTFIDHAQMRELMRVTREHFTLHDDDSGEYSLEIDPREADAAGIALLRELGFNRLSLGVQDFDPAVQKAVNRIQSEEQTFAVLESARAEGFRSVSIDLIYGLPLQSEASFLVTLEKIIAASPDRLSVFNYAHLPEMFKTQRQIDSAQLPVPEEKLAILGATIERLLGAGYVYIGMDHFARPDDELAVAQREGSLYRNFQGYSTHADCDLVAMGATSISMVNRCYSQNIKGVEEYSAALEDGRLPVLRGVLLDDDDLLRREVITRLICDFRLDFDQVGSRCGVDFRAYFAPEIERLQGLANDGLLDLDDRGVVVRPEGRILIRNACMIFDRYLEGGGPRRYSRVI